MPGWRQTRCATASPPCWLSAFSQARRRSGPPPVRHDRSRQPNRCRRVTNPVGESSVVGTRTATTGGDGSAPLVSAGATVALDAGHRGGCESWPVGAVRVRRSDRRGICSPRGGRVRVAAEVAEDAIVAGGRVEIAAPGGDRRHADGHWRRYRDRRHRAGQCPARRRLDRDRRRDRGRRRGGRRQPDGAAGRDGRRRHRLARPRGTDDRGRRGRSGGTVDHRAFDDAEIDIAPPRIPRGRRASPERWSFLLGCVLAGALWLAATPRFLARASLELRARPGISALLGLGVAAGVAGRCGDRRRDGDRAAFWP